MGKMGRSQMDVRYEASKAGQITYVTDEPCRRGHVGPRYTSTGHCVACMKARSLGKSPGSETESFNCLKQDRENFAHYAIALASARWPHLAATLPGRCKVYKNGRICVPCHPDDYADLLSFAQALAEMHVKENLQKWGNSVLG
jgi:hypothetical protein